MNSASVNNRKIIAFAYSLLVAAMLVFTLVKLPSINVDTSVLSLLPKDTLSGISEDVESGYIKRLDSQILILVKTQNINKLESFYAALEGTELFSAVTGHVTSDDEKSAYSFLYTYKTSLIDPVLRERLSNTPYEQTVLKQLYSSFSGVSGKELDNDPLLLTRTVGTTLSASSRFSLKNGYLCVSVGADTYYLLSLSLKDHDMDSKSNDAAAVIDSVISEYSNSDFEVFKRGSLFYSAYASEKVAKEMNFIGVVAGIGVFVLIYIMFRSLTPLLMTLLSVASGLISGFFFLVYFFDSINLIMLGMCLSVIGIVSDYTIYFVTMRMHKAELENAFKTIDAMKWPLVIAASTDVIAYVIILLSPVSPLKQLAMFSSATITFSCLFVVVIEPFFFESIKVHTTKLPVFFEKYLKLIAKKKVSFVILLAILSLALYGAFEGRVNDDPKALQTMPEFLSSQDQRISEITSLSATQKFIVIEADTDDELLERNHKVLNILNSLKKDGHLASVHGIMLNPKAVQLSDFSLVDLKTKDVEEKLKAYDLELKGSYKHHLLTLKEFLNSPFGSALKNLYLETQDKKALVVMLDGVENEELLKDSLASVECCFYQDRHKDYLLIFSKFRNLIIDVIMTFAAVILLVCILRLGIRLGIRAFEFSVLSIFSALGVVTLLGYTINLFITLALLLVLGIGVNYIIFFSNSKKELRPVALTAIVTALLTTLLSVGVLSLSSVAAVSGFAISLCSGIIVSFILSTILTGCFKRD